MLIVAYWLVLIVFWFYIVRLLRKDGYKLPTAMTILWLLGFFGFPLIGLEGGLLFISYGAVLSLILIYVDLFRWRMGLREDRSLTQTAAAGVLDEKTIKALNSDGKHG